ncbi:MAG TPA: amidohydrolase [Planctomycetota bacterium]
MIIALLLAPALSSAEGLAQDDLIQRVDARAARFGDASRKIWEFAEVGYKEKRSVELLTAELAGAGFTIQAGVAGIPTAFTATWGEGRPRIGILGEYDALPGLSQEDVAEKKPREGLGSGHGCGHNLFGAGSALAAVALKEHLAEKKLPGSVRFYGCPAEEGGGGKIYMARAGAFGDCDVVLSWHPATSTRSSLSSNLANITAKFRFRGRAAHAAGSPERGRSALDAVALATHGIDLLREHVPQTTRMHYVITNGGEAPNVVPDLAEIYVYARHPEMDVLDGIWARVLKCAEAGALATETKLEVELVNSAYNLLPNDALAKLVDGVLRRVGRFAYDAEEHAFAEALRKTMPGVEDPKIGRARDVQPIEDDLGYGSTDVGDVSWVVPTINFKVETFVPGTPGHSWQAVACSGSSVGRKGMVIAAKALALSGLELLTNPAELAAAKESFEKRRAGRTYRSRLPADQKPPLTYRDK